MGTINNTTTTCPQPRRCGSGFVTIIVLYILLAILLSSVIC